MASFIPSSFSSMKASSAALNSPGLRIVCISDTHGKHLQMQKIPEGDVLLHTGDFTTIGTRTEIFTFMQWLHGQPHGQKIFIAGNHDMTLDTDYFIKRGKNMKSHKKINDAIAYSSECQNLVKSFSPLYLQDSSSLLKSNGVDTELSCYGSPWQPKFWGAFNLERGETIDSKWQNIPEGIDVLMTHGPPYGFGDTIYNGGKVGCEQLLNRISSMKQPMRLHVFGHIHEDTGTWRNERGTLFVNAATCTTHLRPSHKPIIVHLPFDKTLPATVVDE